MGRKLKWQRRRIPEKESTEFQEYSFEVLSTEKITEGDYIVIKEKLKIGEPIPGSHYIETEEEGAQGENEKSLMIKEAPNIYYNIYRVKKQGKVKGEGKSEKDSV